MKTREKKTKTPKEKKSTSGRIPRKRINKSDINKSDNEPMPGYPLYSPQDDIMARGARVDADLENVKSQDANKATRVDEIPHASIDDEPDVPVNDAYTVTDEDLEALGPADLSMDGGDDEDLKHRSRPVDFAAKDLDIPGSELDDAAESVGSEDEENNSYSVGGDGHNELEEDPA
jgi:hypothetical protein